MSKTRGKGVSNGRYFWLCRMEEKRNVEFSLVVEMYASYIRRLSTFLQTFLRRLATSNVERNSDPFVQ